MGRGGEGTEKKKRALGGGGKGAPRGGKIQMKMGKKDAGRLGEKLKLHNRKWVKKVKTTYTIKKVA